MKVDLYLVGGFAFVPHPVARGYWIRAHPCVAKVTCPFCGSVPGIPCMNKKLGKYVGYTHYDRRKAAEKIKIKAAEIRLTIVEAT